MHPEDFCPFDLEDTGTEYLIFGPEFSVRVPVREEPLGRIFWINEDWFIERGVDVTDADTSRLLREWLIKAFCIRTCDEITDERPQYAHADRYGGTEGTAHGGSGRCVYRGRFNVKGAGPTPLIPPGAANHADGKLGLIEAVRGTIYAELAQLETLKGAIRTVAIIEIPPFDGPVNQRPCLLVRPNFIRPAHAERSLFFGTSGFAGSDQHLDHLRVMAVRRVLAERSLTWKTMAADAAVEIGSLDAGRMAQGRFTSSNMSVVGEIADFDSFRVFDTWAHLGNAKRGERRFGREIDDLVYATKTWAWRTDGMRLRSEAVTGLVYEAHKAGFISTLHAIVPSWKGRRADAQRELCQYIWGVCDLSSRARASEGYWLVDPDLPVRAYMARALLLARQSGFSEREAAVVAGRLQYWRRGHGGLQFANVNAAFEALVRESSPEASVVSSWMADRLGNGRRLHHGLDDWLIPLFVVSGGRILVLFDACGERFTAMWLDAAMSGGRPVSSQPCSMAWATDLARLEDAREATGWRTAVLSVVGRLETANAD